MFEFKSPRESFRAEPWLAKRSQQPLAFSCMAGALVQFTFNAGAEANGPFCATCFSKAAEGEARGED